MPSCFYLLPSWERQNPAAHRIPDWTELCHRELELHSWGSDTVRSRAILLWSICFFSLLTWQGGYPIIFCRNVWNETMVYWFRNPEVSCLLYWSYPGTAQCVHGTHTLIYVWLSCCRLDCCRLDCLAVISPVIISQWRHSLHTSLKSFRWNTI